MSALLVGVMLLAGVPCDRAEEPPSREDGTLGAAPYAPPPGVYTLDPAHSFVRFAAQHRVVGTVRGRFDRMTGTAVAERDPRSSKVELLIEAASINTQNDQRDAELRGRDFFDAATFPTIEYHGTGFRKVGEEWVVEGTLKIRGVIRAVPLHLAFKETAPPQPGEPRRVVCHATALVKRADFVVTRGLLDEIGVLSAKPDVWIEMDAEFQGEPSSPG